MVLWTSKEATGNAGVSNDSVVRDGVDEKSSGKEGTGHETAPFSILFTSSPSVSTYG